jgi:hypothetical protein
MVLDDLFPAEDIQLRKNQEKTLLEILRIVSDNSGRARKIGDKVFKDTPACGVLFTGEYPVGTGSNAARLLHVELSPSPNGEKLKYFQDNPMIISTFYHNFIAWLITNFYKLIDILKELREAYLDLILGVHARLQETHFFLNSAYVLFTQYLFDIDVIDEQEVRALHRSFFYLITDLVYAQDEFVRQGEVNTPTKTDYLALIGAMYRKGEFKIANSAKEFDESRHDGLLNNGCLCLRGKKLDKIFADSASRSDVLDALEAQEALKRNASRRSIQVSGTNGKRFCAIPLKKIP